MAKTNLLLIAFFLLSAVAHGRFLVKLENSDLLSKRFPSETSSDNGEATILKLPSDRTENEIRTKEADSADPIIPSDGDFSEGFHHHHHHHHRFFWRRLWHHVFSHCHRHHRFHHGIGFHHGIRPEVDALEREYVIRRSEPDDDEISARHIPFYLVNDEENVNTGPFTLPERRFHHLRRLPGKRWIPAYRHEDQDGEMEVHAVKSSYPTDFESLFEIMKEKNEDLEDERNLGQEPSSPAMFEHDKMKHSYEDKDEKFEHSFPVMLPGDHHRDENEEKEEKEKEEEEKSFPMRMMQEHHHHHHHHHDENEVEPEGFPMKMHEHHHHHHGEERRFPADSGSGFKKTAGEEEEGGVGGWFQKLVKYFE